MHINFASLRQSSTWQQVLFHFPPQKSQWTKRQYQDDAFAQAIEAFPQLWDVTNPQFKDLEVAKRSWEALAKKHKKIFNLDTVRPVADIEALWVRMQDQTASVLKDAYAKFKLTPEATWAHPQVVLGFCQAKCSFFHAMKFNLAAEKAITQLVRMQAAIWDATILIINLWLIRRATKRHGRS